MITIKNIRRKYAVLVAVGMLALCGAQILAVPIYSSGDFKDPSSDPLAPNANLSYIFVLYTIHNGNIVYPASGTGWAKSGPVWPN